MSRHPPQPVMRFTGSPFDLDGRESWSLRGRSRLRASNAGCGRTKHRGSVFPFPPYDSGAGRDDLLRKTVRPSSTNGTRHVILATDHEYALVGVRSGSECSRMSSRSVFDVED